MDAKQMQLQFKGELTPSRQTCLEILDRGYRAVDAKHLTKRQLSVNATALVAGGHYFEPGNVGKVFVAAFGKCSIRQAEAVEEMVMGTPFADKLTGIAIAAQGNNGSLKKVKVLQGRKNHENLPSLAAVHATQELIAGLKALHPEDLVIFLVSGGASSLLVLPDEGITLQDKIEATRQLHFAGVPIQLINDFRTCVSQVKGGGLLKFVPAGVKAVSIIISDVVGDDVARIGSGPTLWHPKDPDAVLQRLAARDVLSLLPEDVVKYLQHLKGTRDVQPATHVRNILAGNNLQGLRTAEARGREIGFQVLDMADLWDGDCVHTAQMLVNLARNVQLRNLPVSPPVCFLFGGETTVKVEVDPRAIGKGGRNQHLAWLFAHYAREMGLDATRCVFASLGTDGEDGTTDAAGAMVGGAAGAVSHAWPQNIQVALKSYDSHSYFKSNGGLLYAPLHRTNVMDFRILLLT